MNIAKYHWVTFKCTVINISLHMLCMGWQLVFPEKQRRQVSIQLFSENLALLCMSNVFKSNMEEK